MSQNATFVIALEKGVVEENKDTIKALRLTVRHEAGERWETTRTYDEFKTLLQTYTSRGFLCEPSIHNDSGLIDALNALVSSIGARIWSEPAVLKFLDSAQTQSPLTVLKLQALENKLEVLLQEIGGYDQRLKAMEVSSAKMNATLQMVLDRRSGGTAAAAASASSAVHVGDSVEPPVGTPTPRAQRLRVGSDGSISDLSNHSNGGEAAVPGAITSSGETIPAVAPAVSVDAGGEPLTEFFREGLSTNDNGTWGALEEEAESHEEPILEAVMTPAMEEQLSVLTPWVPEHDALVDDMVKTLGPFEAQVVYRDSAVAFLKKQIKAALGCLSFDTGMCDLHCFLPGDTIRITAIVSQSHLAYWHTSLLERLKLLADIGMDPNMRMRMGDEVTDVGPSGIRHVIRHVTIAAEPPGFKVVCNIDALEVEITANNRLDLCMNAFLEDLDRKVGKDHLFKRSMLLIQAWWAYESANYAEPAIKQYLPKTSLNIMITSIFNVYHQFIQTPFQALVLFLKVFSNVNSDTSVITIQGVVPFSANGHQPILETAQRYHLITPELQEKYWYVFNIQEQVPAENANGAAKPTSPSTRHRLLLNSMTRALGRFEKQSLNVIHPFTHANTVLDKMSSRRSGLVTKVFSAGHSNLAHILQQCAAVPLNSMDYIRGFFGIILSRFGSDFRPDSVTQSIHLAGTGIEPTPDKDILQGSLESLWEGVHFANFIVESVISEEAILTFCTDLLSTKGPLPAGEVGKLLSETTSIPQLSHRLREKFGGLKKFLEKFSDVFVFSNDHPFNPHVLLRKAVSEENLELIDRGIFPVHLLAKYSRANNKKAKNNANAMMQPAYGGGAGYGQGGFSSNSSASSGNSGLGGYPGNGANNAGYGAYGNRAPMQQKGSPYQTGRNMGAGYQTAPPQQGMNIRQPWRGPPQAAGAPYYGGMSGRDNSAQVMGYGGYDPSRGGYGGGGGAPGTSMREFAASNPYYGGQLDDMDAYSAQSSACSANSNSGLEPAVPDSSPGSFLSSLRSNAPPSTNALGNYRSYDTGYNSSPSFGAEPLPIGRDGNAGYFAPDGLGFGDLELPRNSHAPSVFSGGNDALYRSAGPLGAGAPGGSLQNLDSGFASSTFPSSLSFANGKEGQSGDYGNYGYRSNY